jgi:4-diphosphocytidyl-2-C-methyl-D-erythritol kinase
MATRVRSYSKINLGLAIGPVRTDGFHGLMTLYQTLALHDLVTVEAKPTSQERDAGHPDKPTSGEDTPDVGRPPLRGSRISLTTNDGRVPADARNTAWKMVELALAWMGVEAEVAIHIEKALPVQGGLGAGSANAAAALIGLERELGMELPEAARLELAAEVGSDVPLFLIGGAVLGTGRGELVAAMPDLPATWCVVAVPEVGVSTPRAFMEWDGLCAERAAGEVGDPTSQRRDPSASSGQVMGLPPSGELTSSAEPDTLEKLSHVYASVFGVESITGLTSDTSGIVRGLFEGDPRNDLAGNLLLELVRTGIGNDFEQVVFPQYPLLRETKHELMGTSAGTSKLEAQPASGNAVYAALSGSGSALFGLYRCERDAKAAQQRVQATGCRAILTETLPREEYWRGMFAE